MVKYDKTKHTLESYSSHHVPPVSLRSEQQLTNLQIAKTQNTPREKDKDKGPMAQ